MSIYKQQTTCRSDVCRFWMTESPPYHSPSPWQYHRVSSPGQLCIAFVVSMGVPCFRGVQVWQTTNLQTRYLLAALHSIRHRHGCTRVITPGRSWYQFTELWCRKVRALQRNKLKLRINITHLIVVWLESSSQQFISRARAASFVWHGDDFTATSCAVSPTINSSINQSEEFTLHNTQSAATTNQKTSQCT